MALFFRDPPSPHDDEKPPEPQAGESAPPPKKPRRFRALALIAALAVFLPALALTYAALAPLPLSGAKTIVIARGTSAQEIARKLHEAGIARSQIAFQLVARWLAKDRLIAGEYRFDPDQTLVDAVLMLREGRSVVRLFTVAEGLTSSEIVALLRNDSALSGAIDRTPEEGTLLPETYRYSYGDTRASLLERMRKAFTTTLSEAWAKRAQGLPLRSPREAVVLASIVEKETGKKAEERARVAGVFYNRLRAGMRLQSDPTVIYAMTKGEKPLGRELTRNDLAFPSPYNTYTSDGLPPGPISNPGTAALRAALHPEKNDFLYFVADGTGGHAFSKTLAEHNKHVDTWHGRFNP